MSPVAQKSWFIILTCTLTKLDPRDSFTISHDDLSIHDLEPYNKVIGFSEWISCKRFNIGFFAHPKPDIIAWNALSPLNKKGRALMKPWYYSPSFRSTHVGNCALHWWIYCAIKFSSPFSWGWTTSWNFRKISGLVFCTTHWP